MAKQRIDAPNLVVVSDLHCGCRLGLCPKTGVPLEDGGTYMPSALQRKLWAMWRHFWDKWVPDVSRGEPIVVVVNGDAIDGEHHRSKTPFSHNIEDHRRCARLLLAPIAKLCEGRFYMITGTAAHDGEAGQEVESLARELGAIPDRTGRHCRYFLWKTVGRGLVHISHHIGTTRRAHYESSAPHAELIAAFTEAGRWRRRPPDFVVRSHRHRHIQTEIPADVGDAVSLVTAGWQLKTSFVLQKGMTVEPPQIGGAIIRQGQTYLYTRHRVWSIKDYEVE